MKISTIKLTAILFIAAAHRSHTFEDEHIKDLAESIKNGGLLNLPTVVETETEGSYILTDGARRVTAMLLLLKQGLIPDEINVQIKPPQSDLDTLADQISGNANVQASVNKEYVESLYKLAASGDYSTEDIAKRVGRSVKWVVNLFKTKKLSDDIWTKVESGNVSLANLISLSDVAGQLEGESLDDMVKNAENMTAKEFSLHVVNERTALREANKVKRGGSAEFVPKEKFIGKDEVRMMLAQADQAFSEDSSEVNEAKLLVLKKVFSMDEEAIAAQSAEFEAKLEKAKSGAADRKKAREQAKLEEQTDQFADLGYKTVALTDKEKAVHAAKVKAAAELEAANTEAAESSEASDTDHH